jgi:hypothetical protein
MLMSDVPPAANGTTMVSDDCADAVSAMPTASVQARATSDIRVGRSNIESSQGYVAFAGRLFGGSGGLSIVHAAGRLQKPIRA